MNKTLFVILLIISTALSACAAQDKDKKSGIIHAANGTILTVKQCASKGGVIFNTLDGRPNGQIIGNVSGLRCPCVCLVKAKPDNTIWVDKNGKQVKFTGNINNIKSFNDCKKAGFRVTDDMPSTCTVGEPHMTGGRYKTFVDHPIISGKNCSNYTYSNCPGSCVPICKSSSCSKPDGDRPIACTSDCDGKGSCKERSL